MAKYLDENGLLYFWQKITAKFATKDDIANAGNGDMLKSVYDTNSNGVVDDAEKLGGQLPDYYAKKDELFSGSYNDLTDKPTDFAPTEHTHILDDITGLPEAAAALSKSLEDAVNDMTEIASGKCAAYVFDTVDALDAALAEYVAFLNDGAAMSDANILKGETLKTGDVFLIRAVDVPDYWWDESTKSKQKLETTKVDLTTITNAEIDTIVGSKGG
jgi:hypothetical protein